MADDVVLSVLQRLLPLEADAALRARVVRLQCDQLRRVCGYVDRARVTRAAAQQAADAAHAETLALEASIGDAVRRARRIRQQLQRQQDHEDERDEEEEQNGDREDELQAVLARARAIRMADDSRDQPVPAPRRIEYPRRLQTLLDQWSDSVADDVAQPFRVAFCRKMVEHVALKETGGATAQDARVQVGYARQVERLRAAYRRVGDYLAATASPTADHVQRALRAPSISSVYPVYCRLQMARAVLGQLHALTKDLAQRLPPRPSLSQAAISHRDAMLQRLRKKAPTPSEAIATASNRLLLNGVDVEAHLPLLEKLQAAWEQELAAAASPVLSRPRPYSNALNETILSEMSNLVLSAFQAAFCEGSSAPSRATMCELMAVIRVAESAVIHKARRQRSVVER